MKHVVFLFGCILSISLTGQPYNLSALSIDQIMQGEEFVGYLPTRIQWSDDSRQIYFDWNPDGDTLRSTYQVAIDTRQIGKLSFDELKAKPEEGETNRDHTWKVYQKNGDLFILNLTDYTTQRITNTLQRESDPQFSGDEKSIIYRVGDDLFKWDREDGSTTQLTNFIQGADKDRKPDPQDRWLEQDQLSQFQILEERKIKEDALENRNEQIAFKRPAKIYLGNKQLRGLAISPDLKYVVYLLVNDAESKNTIVPDYVTRSGYTTDIRSRSKVGAPEDSYESWILDLGSDSAYQIKTGSIEGIYDKPAYARDYATDTATFEEKYESPRETIIGLPLFSEDGTAVVNIISQDHKDRWIMLLELPGGSLKLIDRQHDDAWIGGPGIGWMSRGGLGWIDDETIWFKSEKTGFAHLYSTNVQSGKIKALTKGDFEILDVTLSRDKKTFFILSNQENPHENHFYHMPAGGGKMTQITYMKGGHEVTVSPDEKWLAVRYSYSNQPWELYLMANEKGGEMVRLTKSTSDAFNAYPWRDPEIIRFTARDGVQVPATLFKPAGDKKNGAAVIFVHGAGYLQNVHYWWPQYYREHMFHNLLADNGFTVLAIDYRASAGYGRDWRTAIYRHMGGKDLEDQVDGARYLVEQQGISQDRIGIYGGSYGGFITLMAMFNSAGTFQSGAALRAVTDWAHYNQGYTSAILNTPVEDSLAYVRSSPIYYAGGLQGNLLMLHGMIDTNVHFQDIVRLSQRLIELKKENWELAVFPLEGHGFEEPSSWSDEYRRIFRLFQETLNGP